MALYLLLLLACSLVEVSYATTVYSFVYSGYSGSGYCGGPTGSQTCVNRISQCGINGPFNKGWTIEWNSPASLSGSWSISVGSRSATDVVASTSYIDYSVKPPIGTNNLDIKTSVADYILRFTGCVNAQAPSIISYPPTILSIGQRVTITGAYFGDHNDPVTPRFCGALASLVLQTDNQIVFDTAQTSSLSCKISLNYPMILVESAVIPVTFPAITSYSWTGLPAIGGGLITIVGTNFGTNANSYYVHASGFTDTWPLSVENNKIVFNLTNVGTIGTVSWWTLRYMANPIRIFPVIALPGSTTLPYTRIYKHQTTMQGPMAVPAPIVFDIVRTAQDLVTIHMPIDFNVVYSTTAAAQTTTPFPEDFRPDYVVRCLYMIGGGAWVGADYTPEGYIIFHGVGGDFTQSTTVYPHSCSWTVKYKST